MAPGGKASLGTIILCLFLGVGEASAYFLHFQPKMEPGRGLFFLFYFLIPAYQPPPQERGPFFPHPRLNPPNLGSDEKPGALLISASSNADGPRRCSPSLDGHPQAPAAGQIPPAPLPRNWESPRKVQRFQTSKHRKPNQKSQQQKSPGARQKCKAPGPTQPGGNWWPWGQAPVTFGDTREAPRCSRLSLCPLLW